ncbi:MAG: ABC transporter substrate-binding protein [SAR86 cluster bacterium]|uniref:ABC transporter substrate-binding protein n=1 Tax=SAR86 cluster bacterium TaxID=2030880 RepID=A0A2A4WZ00_9GAMM|nr:MAG: ABC transporter substrate-binding protein [SAR86 cluster bacterium]
MAQLRVSSAVIRIILLFVLLPFSSITAAQALDLADWSALEREARGETVYFNAWGGEPRINSYLNWVADILEQRFDINLQHVKVADISEAVSKIVAERQSSNDADGSIDLMWINGENFAALKENNLLFGPWAEEQPNFKLVNADRFPEMREDFTVPTVGFESPWTRSQLVFYHDSRWLAEPPQTIDAILDWSRSNPGEFTYPRPPAFLGTTFLKQAVLELSSKDPALFAPVTDNEFQRVTTALWDYLDALHPTLLRAGRYFPNSAAELRRLMGDGEISLALAFNPNEALLSIRTGELPDSVRTYVLQGGTIGNVSFLAIPYNAQHKAAAIITANFLLSIEAQARASDPNHMGSTTVISIEDLDVGARRQFDSVSSDLASASPEELSRKLQEPHPSWTPALERAWIRRYSAR